MLFWEQQSGCGGLWITLCVVPYDVWTQNTQRCRKRCSDCLTSSLYVQLRLNRSKTYLIELLLTPNRKSVWSYYFVAFHWVKSHEFGGEMELGLCGNHILILAWQVSIDGGSNYYQVNRLFVFTPQAISSCDEKEGWKTTEKKIKMEYGIKATWNGS